MKKTILIATLSFVSTISSFLIGANISAESNHETEMLSVTEYPIEEPEIEIVYMDVPKTEKAVENGFVYDVTEEEYQMLVRMVMSEGGNSDLDAKILIVQTAINRMNSDFDDFKNQNTIYEVLTYPNAFSLADNGEPNAECYKAVNTVLKGVNLPTNIYWFCYGFEPYYGESHTIVDGWYFNSIEH